MNCAPTVGAVNCAPTVVHRVSSIIGLPVDSDLNDISDVIARRSAAKHPASHADAQQNGKTTGIAPGSTFNTTPVAGSLSTDSSAQ
ncbi:MAG: hypothetical protein ACYDER_19140 [Ktedonobacteraceae bacterium]